MTRARGAGWATIGMGLAGMLGMRVIRGMLRADLAGQVVLITGGSRGLGLQLAREFAALGCRLVLCARDEQELARADRELTGAGQKTELLSVVADVSSRDDVDYLVEAAYERFGHIDILVNNAGIIQVGPLESMSIEDFKRSLEVNFLGTVYTTMAALPSMRQRRQGRIVNIASIGGKVAVPHLLPYDCAKFAVVGFSEGLHAEVAKDGIIVTTIIPGLMRTGSPLHASFKGNAREEFAFFGMGDVSFASSMNATRAARRIVRAVQRGEAEVVLSIQARMLRVFHDLFPGFTADLLGFVNRFLPAAQESVELFGGEMTGEALQAEMPFGLGSRLERDAKEYNQRDGESELRD